MKNVFNYKSICLYFSAVLSIVFSASVFAQDAYDNTTFFAEPFASTMADCPQALGSDDPGFCSSFKSVAQCHCTSAGLPAVMCQNVETIYKRMIALYGSQENACQRQNHTSKQECMDDWNCYRLGGLTSQGAQCAGTGKSCQ